MTENEQPTPPPAKPTPTIGLFVGICVTAGMLIGRVAGDAVRESLGWWGAMAIGTLAAMLGAVIALFIIQIWQRQNSKGSNP